MKIERYERPISVDQAYSMILDGGTVIGGGTWLKLSPKKVSIAVDLTLLGLDSVRRTEDGIEIGAMVTLQQLMTEPLVQDYLSGMIPYAIRQIMGVPFRNIATVGGTVAGRYGFSDLITPLLSADAILHFHDRERISLESYLEGPADKKDLLLSIVLPENQGRGAFMTVKKTSNDFPILNAGVVFRDGVYRVAVGARPGTAGLAYEAMALLNEYGMDKSQMAGVLAAAELKFGSNMRGSKEYREALCKTLVTRCVREVQQ